MAFTFKAKAYKNIFIDFDGVIVDSMPQKLEAFYYALKALNPDREKLKTIQTKMAGLSRTEVLKQMYLQCTGTQCDETILDSLLTDFAQIDRYYQKQLQPLEGVVEFLEKYSANLNLYIVTGTPQKVIQTSIDILEMPSYFKGIYGSPKSKTKIIQSTIQSNQFDLNESVMIGDGAQDQLAAIHCGIDFIGVVSDCAGFDSGKAVGKVESISCIEFAN